MGLPLRRVPAAVVEVQVTVHDHGDVVKDDSGRCQGVLQRSPAGAVVRFGFRVRVADAGIEEDQPLVVLHQVGKDRFDPWLWAARLRRRPDEVSQVESAHRNVVPHAAILAEKVPALRGFGQSCSLAELQDCLDIATTARRPLRRNRPVPGCRCRTAVRPAVGPSSASAGRHGSLRPHWRGRHPSRGSASSCCGSS